MTAASAVADLKSRAGSRFRTRNRLRKVRQVRSLMEQEGIRSVLLVGVAGRTDDYANVVECAVADGADFVVWSGLHSRPVGDPYVAADALRLPFGDQSFDLVFSNAVIEHVGGREAQRTFVAEHARVGSHWFITTPNRRYPVESHTEVLFRHWFRDWRESRPEFSRLLDRSEFRALLPAGATIEGGALAPTFTAMR